MLKKYNDFSKGINEKLEVLNESAPRIPNSEEYWKKKGKSGKNVMLYFHDDLDGIYSAIAMKGYLEKKGFEIVGYGIVNYQEGWSGTELNPETINIALDYAENTEGIDVYIDHHGHFEETDKQGELVSKDKKAVKTHTSSAYEGIMDQLGMPVDSLVMSIIDMVDSAKYDEYEVDIKEIINFDVKKFKNKLEFAAAFNQLLKRSDSKTFIEVVANSKDINPSIYNIFKLFRILYPANNLDNMKMKKFAKDAGFETEDAKGRIVGDVAALIQHIKDTNPKDIRDFRKDFLDDAYWRLGQMQSRTWGNQVGGKQYVDSQAKFKELFARQGRGGNDKVDMPGYQIIGNMCFVPSGTWANALRARAILERDLLNDENIPIIEYSVSKNSPLYDEMKEKDGKTLELVGDISGTDTYKKTFDVKKDVTNEPDIEGIKGIVEVHGGDVIFRAKQPIFWILLQYGNTMQVASLHKFEHYVTEYLPKLKDGSTVEDLGKYCKDLLYNMAYNLGYNVSAIPDASTKAGGHKGIGSISNIFGSVKQNQLSVPNPNNPGDQLELSSASEKMIKQFDGVRFLDLIKNKMISDLSGVKFDDLKMQWGDPDEKPAPKPRSDEMNKKVMLKDQIRKAQDVEKQEKEWDDEEVAQRNAKLK